MMHDRSAHENSDTGRTSKNGGRGLAKPGRLRRWSKRLVITLVILIIVYLLGPRITNSEIEHRGAAGVPDDLSELDDYLAKSEGRFSADLVAGTEKVIRWQPGRHGEQTEFSVVYLHGFGGSHPTLAPAMDLVADGLEANLFCTRYAGHGRKEPNGFGKAMGEVTLQDWVDDTAEALAIGRKLGKRLVVIANSTAAPTASWLASQGDEPDFFIMWSPNFGLKGGQGEALLRPWGNLALALRSGDTHQDDPSNIYGPVHERYATTIYPDRAFLPMMAAIKLGRDADLERIACPTLCLYSKRDQVVSTESIETHFRRFVHPRNQLVEILGVTHRKHHVIAGDLMSPESTEEVVQASLDFVRQELPHPQ